MALGMVGEPTNGETQEQIIDALNMEMIRNETGKLFRELYFDNEIGRLNLANSLWLNENVAFDESRLERLAKDYYAYSFSLDFKNKASSKKISNWVSENTRGKLGTDSNDFILEPDDVMRLINTISFYDEWQDSFNVNDTEKDTFHLEDGNEVETDFMNMIHPSQEFAELDGYMVSQLNLKNNNSMMFILPDEEKSLYDIVSDPNVLEDAINALSSNKSKMGEVVFKVPKFKFSSELELKETARKLGIKDAFENTANFTTLSETKPLFISNIEQSAFFFNR